MSGKEDTNIEQKSTGLSKDNTNIISESESSTCNLISNSENTGETVNYFRKHILDRFNAKA